MHSQARRPHHCEFGPAPRPRCLHLRLPAEVMGWGRARRGRSGAAARRLRRSGHPAAPGSSSVRLWNPDPRTAKTLHTCLRAGVSGLEAARVRTGLVAGARSLCCVPLPRARARASPCCTKQCRGWRLATRRQWRLPMRPMLLRTW